MMKDRIRKLVGERRYRKYGDKIFSVSFLLDRLSNRIELSRRRNKVARRRFKFQKIVWPSLYRRAARKDVRADKVVFVEGTARAMTNNFQQLYRYLVRNFDLDISVSYLLNGTKFTWKRKSEFVKHIGDAKYIFLNDRDGTTDCIRLRPESVLTQIFHACGAFKKFGYSTQDLRFGVDRKTREKYPPFRNQTYVTVSGKKAVGPYIEAMGMEKERERVRVTGVSRTDVFFSEAYKADAARKLRLAFPASEGRKVILYAPTFRGAFMKASAGVTIDMPFFKERLADDYVLVCKYHPLVKVRPPIPAALRDFAIDLTNAMDINDLICVADVLITDYSSLVFEYALLEKPVIFYAYDLEDYYDDRGFYYPYEELSPGPICRTNTEMVAYLEDMDARFDPERIREFTRDFMDGCDGHATERIAEMVFGDALEPYRREAPLPDEAVGLPRMDHREDVVVSVDSGRLNGPEAEKRVMKGADRKALTALFGAGAADKKIVAYLPLAGTPGGSEWYPDFIELAEELHAVCVIALHRGGGVGEDVPLLTSFVADVSLLMEEDDLIDAADLIVTDHRELNARGKPVVYYVSGPAQVAYEDATPPAERRGIPSGSVPARTEAELARVIKERAVS
jgi:CDP-ribitol ribitolphosphotransferase